jgi:multiple antibiotic resistance protein
VSFEAGRATGIDDGTGGFMQRAKLIGDAITLLVVIDPISVVPLFLALTRGLPRERRRRVARRGVLIAGAILLSFIAVGEIVLDALKITLPAFRVAGGLVLLLVALKMILQEEHRRGGTTDDGATDGPDIAVFPLAMPFIAGPGAIMAAVLLTENGTFSIPEQAVTAAIVVGILAIMYVVLLGADAVQRVIGSTGATVLTRVLGLVLAALATQTMLDGLRPFLAAVR